MSRDEGWLSISAYARAYGIDRGTVYKWLEARVVISYRVGRLIRIKDEPPQQKPFKKWPSEPSAAGRPSDRST
jgi:excisionase family DNA binding protein